MICIGLVLFDIPKMKKALKIIGFEGLCCKMSFRFRTLAESEGFEPPVPLGTTVFKTAAFDRSANSLDAFLVNESANLQLFN
jgi:hypothetical protein